MENSEQISQKPGVDSAAGAGTSATLDAAEVERFGKMAAKWWDPMGDFRPLHQLGPARLTFIRDEISSHFIQTSDGVTPTSDGAKSAGGGLRPLKGLSILDIGCGGGLISEPLARLGATVTGLDPASESIKAARHHAEGQGLNIDYQDRRAEELVAESKTFDAVLCLEVIEHVPDPAAFVQVIAPLVRPGGIMIASTINRTVKSYGLAIVGAEYVLRWLPVGTHQWERFVTPDELSRYAGAAGLKTRTTSGVVYSILSDIWSLAADTDVNYMMSAVRPA